MSVEVAVPNSPDGLCGRKATLNLTCISPHPLYFFSPHYCTYCSHLCPDSLFALMLAGDKKAHQIPSFFVAVLITIVLESREPCVLRLLIYRLHFHACFNPWVNGKAQPFLVLVVGSGSTFLAAASDVRLNFCCY